MFASGPLSENDACKVLSDALAEYRGTREQGKEIRWRGRQSRAILFKWTKPRISGACLGRDGR
jgi:hypothetical protein